MLKYSVTADELAALDDSVRSLYKEKDGLFLLEVEGATSKTKVDEFRQTNIELQNKLKAFDNVDMTKYSSMLEVDRKVRNKELIDKGDFDSLLAENTAVMKSDYETKMLSLVDRLEMSDKNASTLISKYEIEGAAHKAFSIHKIQPDAQDAVMAQIKGLFSINNGKVVAMDGDNIKTGADGNLTVAEFVSKQPEFMKISSSGGNGSGNDDSGNTGNPNAKRDAYQSLVAKA